MRKHKRTGLSFVHSCCGFIVHTEQVHKWGGVHVCEGGMTEYYHLEVCVKYNYITLFLMHALLMDVT